MTTGARRWSNCTMVSAIPVSGEEHRSLRKMPVTSSANILDLVQVSRIPLGLHIVPMDEPQRGRVDAIAQSTAILRTVFEDVSQMAICMHGPYLGARHAMGAVL